MGKFEAFDSSLLLVSRVCRTEQRKQSLGPCRTILRMPFDRHQWFVLECCRLYPKPCFFNNIWRSSLSTVEEMSIIHNTAVTKQWTTEWP